MVLQRIEDFLQYLRFEKRYSPHTILAYKRDLLQFQEYISVQFDLDELQSLASYHVRSWLASLKEAGQSPRSINRKLSVINSLYKFLMRQGAVVTNPVTQIHSLKLPERLPQYLKETETRFLFEELSFGTDFRGFTERLICELLYQTGMRRSEIIGLKEADIEWSLRQVRVLGKGNKERLIPLNEDILSKIKDYLNEKRNIAGCDEDHLLVRENGQHLYASYVYQVVRKYLWQVTTLKKKSPHVMRHTFATHLLNNGANIQAIKDLLGHSSLAATQVYTHNNIEKLKEIHKLNHPRG